MGKIPDNDKGALPLFDYASKFDDFFTYDGFRSYLIHCIQSSGFAMKMIAGWMRLSPTGLSIRMSEAPQENQPHFSDEQIDLYLSNSGDPRPWHYLKWRQEQAIIPKEKTLMEMVQHLNAEVKRMNLLLEGK